jgi:hypothetical protein
MIIFFDRLFKTSASQKNRSWSNMTVGSTGLEKKTATLDSGKLDILAQDL